MEGLCNELIFCIVGRMDIPTMKNFMVVNKKMAFLIRANEADIAKKQASYFPVPPTADILSSTSPQRRVLSYPSWVLVSELERRMHRIDHILTRCPNVINLNSIPGIGALIPEQKTRLLPLLRRAMCHYDAIADIAANVPWTPIEPATPEMNGRDLWALSVRHDDQKRLEAMDPFRKLSARGKQLEYVKALPLDDLAILLLLTNTMGVVWARRHNLDYAATQPGNAFAKEHILIYEESLLRHGSWFIWVHRTAAMVRLGTQIMISGHRELTDWEMGEHIVMPGIKMTLVSKFREHTKAIDDAVGARPPPFMPKVFEYVRKMLRVERRTAEENNNDMTGDGLQAQGSST